MVNNNASSNNWDFSLSTVTTPSTVESHKTQIITQTKPMIDESDPNFIFRFKSAAHLKKLENQVHLIQTSTPGWITKKEAGPIFKSSNLPMKTLKTI